ncbi:MAG: hypothetical protein AAF250_12330 [Pseudomonadota bacterium]
MRIIPSAFHGVLDYAVAATLVIMPFVLGFQGIALMLAVAGGVGLFLYSLITDYSMSARKLLPFRVHLMIDFAAAAVLTAAPFLFGFEGLERAFYLVIGLSVIAVVLITNPETDSADQRMAA